MNVKKRLIPIENLLESEERSNTVFEGFLATFLFFVSFGEFLKGPGAGFWVQ